MNIVHLCIVYRAYRKKFPLTVIFVRSEGKKNIIIIAYSRVARRCVANVEARYLITRFLVFDSSSWKGTKGGKKHMSKTHIRSECRTLKKEN